MCFKIFFIININNISNIITNIIHTDRSKLPIKFNLQPSTKYTNVIVKQDTKITNCLKYLLDNESISNNNAITKAIKIENRKSKKKKMKRQFEI